jgi:hypothetical protein
VAPRWPDFLIIGAQKSGTTTLRVALNQHPDIACARETHYFCERFDRGHHWYLGQFEHEGDAALIGEKCPHYLYDPAAIDRMAEHVPDARLVVVLRDPVSRAYSQYWHQRRLHLETLGFEAALDAEPARADAGVHEFDYVARGRYAEQLRRVLDRFPRESLLVLLFEDLRADPQRTFDRVVEFLGAAPGVELATADEAANPYRQFRFLALRGAMTRWQLWRRLPRAVSQAIWRFTERPAAYEPMPPPLRARLEREFTEPNRELAELLGLDLSSWGVRP